MIGRYGPPIFQILKGIEGAYNVALIKTIPTKKIDRLYWYYFLKQEKLFRFMELLSRRSSGQTGVELPALRAYELPLPPMKEQLDIATALADMDALISGLDQLIAKKRDIKQATMQQLLTGQTRLPGFSGEWEVKSLGDLETEKCLKLFRGKVISKKDIEKSPGNYPIYSSSVKENGVFGYYGEFMLDEELITWSVDGGGHFFYRQKHKFSVTNVCGYLRVGSPRINCRFLAFQLQFLHSRMLFDYSSKAHPSVIRKAYEIMLPRSDEQSAIASTLSDMDSEISILEARCDKARQLKQGMMQELLTGRIRLI